MSTKKEKCCGCPEKQDLCRGECICHHPQSESIEWEEVQEVHSEVIKVMESIGFGLLLDGQTFYKKGYELKPREHTTFSMTQAYEIKNAITSAVAKRELKIAEEVAILREPLPSANDHKEYNRGIRDGFQMARGHVLSLLKH